MKRVEKEIKRIEKEVVYIANDGTEFTSSEECTKYEESAKCVIMTKYKKLVVATKSESEIYTIGSDEYFYDFVKVSTKEDCDIVMQAFFFFNKNCSEEVINKNLNVLGKALEEKDLLLICRGYEEDAFGWLQAKSQILEEIAKNLSE